MALIPLERVKAQSDLISELADRLMCDADGKELPSVDILRNAEALISSLIIDVEHPTEHGSRFGSSFAGAAVVSALKEIDAFAGTQDECMVLKKRLIHVLVDNCVADYEERYICSPLPTALAQSQ